jgi:hypothetical protein
MVKTYSHIRRDALNQAAAALQPQFRITQPSVEMAIRTKNFPQTQGGLSGLAALFALVSARL